MRKRIIVTGGAGFIGSNLCDFLLKEEWEVTCIDNFDDYYSPNVKWKNLENALSNPNFKLIEQDINNISAISEELSGEYEAIIHLAAKAGVRYSIEHPVGYEESNVKGTKNTLDLALKHNIKQFIFASSSSIYGKTPPPFNEDLTNLKPISPYAQTKLFSEKLGKEYTDIYDINFISLRFFSVYGPRLRPDLVMNKIAKSIFHGEKLKVFGDGSASRDYTFVDDIISGVYKAVDYKKTKFEIFNLGNGNPIKLIDIITKLEDKTGIKTNIDFVESIKEESDITWADNNKAKDKLDFSPQTNIDNGVDKYLNWFIKNYKV